MRTLNNIIRLRKMYAVRAVHTLQAGVMLVDLKNDRAGALKDGAPGVVGDPKTAVALRVRLGDRNKCHVAADVLIAVEIGQRAQHDRQEFYQPAGLELALIVADVPAVVREALLLRITLDNLDALADNKPATHLHILDLSLARRKRLVQQLGEARAEAIVHPVAGAHCLDGFLWSDKLGCFHFQSPSVIIRGLSFSLIKTAFPVY